MDDMTVCNLCNAAMPAARQALGKALGTAAFGALGLKKTKDPVEQLAMFLIGLGLGHVADLLVAELAKPICGHCRAQQRLAPA